MTPDTASRLRAAFVLLVASAALAGCAQRGAVTKVRLSERECLARAMYFESNRSSDAGMLAVGTVVMNRLKSGKYGSTVCEVVGAPRQFAPGVLTRPMTDRGAPRARRVADAVLAGRRHSGVQNAEFFHTAGYKFPYRNMRYVLVAGGNAFYDKRKPPKAWWGGEGRWGPPPPPSERIDGGEIMVARVEVEDDRGAGAPERADSRMAAAEPRPARRGSVGGIAIYEPPPSRLGPAAPPRRAAEFEIAEADLRPSEEEPRSRRSAGGVPIYEPPPSARPLPSPRGRTTQVAALEAPIPANRAEARGAVREDAGLREEDRWRDEELAEEQGRRPASPAEWRDRREPEIRSEPLPELAPEPERPVRTARAARPSASGEEGIGAEPRPSGAIRAAPRPRAVEARSQPAEADPAALGWRAGPAPARMERGESLAAADDMDGYRPLSRAADDAGAAPARRVPQPRTRSYGGVDLGEMGFR